MKFSRQPTGTFQQICKVLLVGLFMEHFFEREREAQNRTRQTRTFDHCKSTHTLPAPSSRLAPAHTTFCAERSITGRQLVSRKHHGFVLSVEPLLVHVVCSPAKVRTMTGERSGGFCADKRRALQGCRPSAPQQGVLDAARCESVRMCGRVGVHEPRAAGALLRADMSLSC